jgi:acyl carrier protein
MNAESEIASAARENLARVLDAKPDPEGLELDLDLADGYGLTSLNKVLFLMSACEETGVSLSAFTEPDVAAMRTLRDVITGLSAHCETAV